MDFRSIFSFHKDEEASSSEPPPANQKDQQSYQELIERLANMKSVTAKEVMTPRALVQAVDLDVEIQRLHLWKTGRSRYLPVYQGDLDHILGWMPQETLRDLFHSGFNGNLRSHFVPAEAIHEDLSLDQIFMKFVHTSAPLLVVRGVDAVTTGVLFLHDVLEAFFGIEIESPIEMSSTSASGS